MEISDFITPFDFNIIQRKAKGLYPFNIKRTRKTSNGYIRLIVEGYFVPEDVAKRWNGQSYLINLREEHEFFEEGKRDRFGAGALSDSPRNVVKDWGQFRKAANELLEEFMDFTLMPVTYHT